MTDFVVTNATQQLVVVSEVATTIIEVVSAGPQGVKGDAGGVISVNGLTDVVTLTAASVGAEASGAVAAERSTNATLTNKTISADSNTLSGVAASSFVLSNASGHIDGAAAQKVIPAGVVVGTTDAQLLTNKTIVAANNTITTAASGNLAATSLNAALAELQSDIDTRATSASLGTMSAQAATSVNIDGGAIDNTVIGGTTPVAGSFTTLSATGNTTLGDAEATDVHSINGVTTVLANSASPALKVTQTGSGNTFVVEDAASDTTPFVIDANCNVIKGHTSSQLFTTSGTAHPGIQSHATNGAVASIAIGYWGTDTTGASFVVSKSNGGVIGTHTIVSNSDVFGNIRFSGSDGSKFIDGASISAAVDGTPGINDMPGRLVFSTTADGASTPTERMRIDANGNVGIGTASPAGSNLFIRKTLSSTDSTTPISVLTQNQFSGTLTSVTNFHSQIRLDPSATVTTANSFMAGGANLGAGSEATVLIGFQASSGIVQAANNYGFYANITDGVTRNVSTVERTSNVVTITTSTAHGAAVGQSIEIKAVTNTSLNGTFVITATPTTTSISYAQVGTDIVSVADTGTTRGVGRFAFYNAASAPSYSLGRFVLGSSPTTVMSNGGAVESILQINGINQTYSSAIFSRWNNDTAAAFLEIGKSRGATVGSHVIVQASDTLGILQFSGSDGTTLRTAVAISAVVDGTPGASDMPGRLVFSTTADGAINPTERMRINSAGLITANNSTGLGYGTGSGGTVTQVTNRTTGVTLNKPSGAITLVSAAGSTAWQTFIVTNSVVAATDVIQVSQKSGSDNYMVFVTNVGTGSFQISFATTGGTTTEQPVFSFAVLKGAVA